MPYGSAGGAVASSAARPGLSVLMPLPGRVPSADREFSRALPRHKKIRVLQCHRGFHGWTCQGPELNFYVTRLSPKQKCRPAIRCSSPASPPVSRPGSTRQGMPAGRPTCSRKSQSPRGCRTTRSVRARHPRRNLEIPHRTGTRAQATPAAVAVRHGCRGSQATWPPALPLSAACW